jgi:hypothetical protein
MDTKAENESIHIREAVHGTLQFVLHPEGDELFTRTGRQVIEACRLGISIEVWLHECEDMLRSVVKWIEGQAGRVRSCYAVPRDAGISLFFVPTSDTFDFDLADELAKLNRKLVQSYNVGTVEVHQVPDDELDRFLVPENSRQVYSDASGSHQPVET